MQNKTIIVHPSQDEALRIKAALEIILPQLNIVGCYSNANDALQATQALHPTFVVADATLSLNEDEWLNAVQNLGFDLLITAPNASYAMQAFQWHAAGFLLLPLAADDVRSVVHYLWRKRQQQQSSQTQHLLEHLNSHMQTSPLAKLALPTQHEVEFVNISDIVRCESFRNYTTFHLLDKRAITVSRSLGEYEKILLPNSFLRVHKSHLINMVYVRKFIKCDGGQLLMSDGVHIDVSTGKRDELMLKLSLVAA